MEDDQLSDSSFEAVDISNPAAAEVDLRVMLSQTETKLDAQIQKN